MGHHLYVRTRVCVYVKGELDPYCTSYELQYHGHSLLPIGLSALLLFCAT